MCVPNVICLGYESFYSAPIYPIGFCFDPNLEAQHIHESYAMRACLCLNSGRPTNFVCIVPAANNTISGMKGKLQPVEKPPRLMATCMYRKYKNNKHQLTVVAAVAANIIHAHTQTMAKDTKNPSNLSWIMRCRCVSNVLIYSKHHLPTLASHWKRSRTLASSTQFTRVGQTFSETFPFKYPIKWPPLGCVFGGKNRTSNKMKHIISQI